MQHLPRWLLVVASITVGLRLVKGALTRAQGDPCASSLYSLPVPLQIPNPEFEGQTKTRLGNPEVRKLVDNNVAAVCPELWLIEIRAHGNTAAELPQPRASHALVPCPCPCPATQPEA